jgi:putative membrane protein
MSFVSKVAKPLKLGTVVGVLAGIALIAWLLHSYGIVRVGTVLMHAGVVGILVVIAIHLPQMLCSALGWQAIAAPTGSRLSLRTLFWLRWIREAVNNLLPLTQIGGEFIAARLMRRRGMHLAHAIGGVIADLMLETATQVIFTVLGLALLVQAAGHTDFTSAASRGLLLAAVGLVAAFVLVRLGVVKLMEKGALKLGKSLGWPNMAQISGLHAAVTCCLRSPRAVAVSALWHLASWILGGVEVCVALHYFGHDTSFASGLIIESLGQASKSAGFAIPGALGVQEAGYVVICRLLGIPAETALALSLIKRLREVLLGLPGLFFWYRAEGRGASIATPVSEGAG